MKQRLKRWPTGLAVLGIVCGLGFMSFTYGLARLEQQTTGQGVMVHTQLGTELTDPIGTENQREAKNQTEIHAPETTGTGLNPNPTHREDVQSEFSVKDFPSPVQAEPLRAVGNYFSENLNAYLYHAGTDYPQPEGAVIRATHGGKVTFAGADPILGQKVEINCGDNWHVVYGSLDNLRVQPGDVIEKNTILGQIGYDAGADGVNDRTQLHYEIWQGNHVLVP